MTKSSYNNNKNASRIIAKILTILIVSLMIVYAVSLMVPIVYLILNSFKNGNREYVNNLKFAFPKKWMFENYTKIFNDIKYKVNIPSKGIELTYHVWDMAFYSFYYSIISAIYSVVTLLITSYAVGRYKDFWLSKLLFKIGLVWMLIPFVSDGGASLLLKKRLGIYDNLFLWVFTSGSCIFTGQWFFIMVAYFRNLGKDYAEAASIDGASEGIIFLLIMVPLAMPLMCLIFFLSFIAAWNNYSTFLYYLPSYANLALGMYDFQNMASISGEHSVPEVLAGFVIVCIPTVILYFLSHNLIINNLNVGGIKG